MDLFLPRRPGRTSGSLTEELVWGTAARLTNLSNIFGCVDDLCWSVSISVLTWSHVHSTQLTGFGLCAVGHHGISLCCLCSLLRSTRFKISSDTIFKTAEQDVGLSWGRRFLTSYFLVTNSNPGLLKASLTAWTLNEESETERRDSRCSFADVSIIFTHRSSNILHF